MAPAGKRSVAIVLSGVFHLVVFAWLLDQRHAAPVIDPPPMLVSLVPSTPHPLRKPVQPVPKRPSSPPAPGPHLHDPEAALPVPAPTPRDRNTAEADRVRQALRGLIGCAPSGLAGMSAEARRRCQEQFAASTAKDRDWARLGLDKTGEFAASQNPEPYLTRKPKNGCKVRAAGDTDVRGQEGARAGISCSFSF